MRYVLSKFDKNGIKVMGDMYCWECTGSFQQMRSKKTGKGRMVCIKVDKEMSVPHYTFRCVKCSYESTYVARYQEDYGIR